MFPLPAALTALLAAAPSAAQPPEACQPPFTRDRYVQCVVLRSADIRIAEADVRAAEGRMTSADALLPSQPELSLQGARRTTQEQSAWNGYLTLSQTVELAGQRGLRGDAAVAGKEAVEARMAETRRAVALIALSAWYELRAAEEQALLGEELADISGRLSELAKAQSTEGLISPLDETLARAQSSSLELERQRARRELTRARLTFAALVRSGVDDAKTAGDEQLPAVNVDAHALPQRAALVAANADVRAAAAERSLVERSWVPSPTVSGFIQNDGFNERVLGVGISVPLPTPSSLRSGQVEERRAVEQRARAQADLVERQLRTELADAVDEDAYRQACLQAVDEKTAQRAREDLQGLATALTARELPLREALLAQRSLVELLHNYSATRAAAVRARLELLRVAALPLPGVTP